ncbi:LINE-1 retrotransposable element ORF2 protein [Eumeta japonica]|uniref:LINE-1 retrotransposable element ORF2 protein n=1 Tax=Eumeta variegata TaxID=151549 RepID=A0A4C1U007_EUMVA|nr:LINE-1 retrotransposable element ORF2 protein [Eumeta japonica]
MTRESGNHYDSIVTLQTQDRYASQNTQKSPQSSNRPSQIASLPTTYRTALAIYEDWGLGIQDTHMTSGSFTSEHYIWILSGGKKAQETRGVGIIIRKNAISRIIKIQRKSNSVLDSKLLLLGDFNAHIGRDDNRGTKKLVVGYNLFHPTLNHLGSFLLDFCEQNLVISSTWGRRSCKHGQNPLDWNQLTEILRSSIREHLKFNKNKSKTSRLALPKFMKAKFWKNRSPKDPAMIQNFKDARKELLDLQEKEDEEKCQHFFAQMHRPTESCLVSKNIRQSYGLDKTQSITKRKGVKQGCPLSPRLFTIVLDDVLRTLEELVSEVRLDQDAEINLPVILSFADDIIIIGDSTTVLTNIMKNLKELLISVGLKLNETKTKMLVRDPINKSIAKQTQEINGVLITPVDTIKYLGTYLTSELSRRDTIKARCKQAIRNAKGLIPFIKKTKMHWKIAKLIYKMVISPSMTYGLNVVALTKSNRTRLRQYEREILKDMLQAARNQPKLKTQEILEGKTITKIIKVRRICYYGHLLRRDQPTYLTLL